MPQLVEGASHWHPRTQLYSYSERPLASFPVYLYIWIPTYFRGELHVCVASSISTTVCSWYCHRSVAEEDVVSGWEETGCAKYLVRGFGVPEWQFVFKQLGRLAFESTGTDNLLPSSWNLRLMVRRLHLIQTNPMDICIHQSRNIQKKQQSTLRL